MSIYCLTLGYPKSITLSFFKRISKSVASYLLKPASSSIKKVTTIKPVTKVNTEAKTMRQTAVKLAKSYSPMIKFVGTKHPIPPHSSEVRPHACTVSGLLPGSPDCIPAGQFLSKLKPFTVTPFKSQAVKAKPAPGSKQTYEFTDRPLEKNEVSSIFELPAQFRFKPLDAYEIDVINGGGAP